MATRVTSNEIDARVMLNALTAVKRGDFSVRLPSTWTGHAGKVASSLNDIIESNQRLELEVRRLSKRAGKEGQIKRAGLGDAGGVWASTLDAVNDLIEDLVRPNAEMARVISAVANGDLSQTMALEIEGRRLQGQFLETARTVNTMVNQLRSFSSEVTRVAGEVGTEGKLGGQAHVRGVGGVYRCRRQRGPLEEDHRRGAGRDPGAQGHGQHDGRPAQRFRRRGDACGGRGRHRGPARRSGPGARRRRRLERPDRQRELHGR